MLTGRRTTHLAAVAALAVAAASCSGGDDEPGPGQDELQVPEGVTLTSGGSTMDIGQSASVVDRPKGAERTVITVRVSGITRGAPSDVEGVEGVVDGAVPFYVEASVRNDGPASEGGAPVPLFAVDESGRKLRAVRPSRPVPGCDPLPADTPVDRGDTETGCLLFTVRDGSALGGIRLRTRGLDRPVTWRP